MQGFVILFITERPIPITYRFEEAFRQGQRPAPTEPVYQIFKFHNVACYNASPRKN